MKQFRFIFCFLIFTLPFIRGCGWTFAADVKFSASVNKSEVGAGERFQVTFQINTSGTDFSPPNFDKFSVLSGPNQSTSMQFINGAMSSSVSYSYILVAPQEGDFTIGAASIKANGKTYSSDPIKIKVVKGSAPQQPAQRGQQQPSSQGQSGNVSDYVFIKLFLDKNKAYVGEQLIATYKIFFRTNIVNNEIEKLPSFNGFWTQEIDLPQQAGTSQEVVNGVAYNVATLKQSLLFPQRTGTLEVDPLGLNVVLRLQDNSRQRSIFDQFFGSYRDVKYTLNSNKVKVEVIPLPEQGKPDDFDGAVGKYSLEATINKSRVKANEAVNLKVVISGKGNIKLIEPFTITFPTDFETYDPKTNDKISALPSGLSGRKEFEYLLIPRHSGSFKIEPLSFSYFDPASKQYVTLNSGEMNIDVEKVNENEPAGTTFSSVNKEDVKLIGRDIRFIKSGMAELQEKNRYFFNTINYYSLLFAPYLGFILLLIFRQKYYSSRSDIAGMKKRRATRVATQRLRIAKKALENNERIKFYEETFKAIYGYLGDKLVIPLSDLSKENIAASLRAKSVNNELADKLFSALDRCDMARFAPVNDVSESQVYENTVEIISKLEEELK